MNKSKLKNYAPKARREFIQAVKDRAAVYGLTKGKTEEATVSGDFVIIAGKPFPKAVANQRETLEERIQRSSFGRVMEEIAYTWFNRFVAIRYMELHGYLSHGYRVLSHTDADSPVPEIIEKAVYVDLPGLNKEKVVELKMDGTKDEELYRILLIAQCNELYHWMPFLFENIRDCTELLLPDNLMHSDSLIRKLVDEIEEEDWQEVEIIGWMYQFYISEKKDQVIGSVVKSEDIPAATQLFTPNWIVKYLVQNSLGAQWKRTYPNSPLKEKMEFYIEPTEQTEEVQKQLAEITPDSLNPEELTLLDPACGSGHILVEAYDLLKEIYLERGYRRRDIPELILTKNLFGLEIDDRAAQLAGFAAMMKARADDRRIFEKSIVPNIVSIQESKELDIEDTVRAINEPLTSKDVSDSPRSMEELQDSVEVPLFVIKKSTTKISLNAEEKLTVDDLKALLGLFEHGKTFGSLIRVPEKLAEKIPSMAQRVEKACKSGQPYAQAQAEKVQPFIQQAIIMAGRYDAVVANPPYIGNRKMNVLLTTFARANYPDSWFDLFAMFIERELELSKIDTGFVAMVTMQSWMFLSAFEKIRRFLLDDKTIYNMAHLGARAFSTISGEVVTVTAFSIINERLSKYKPSFLRLIDGGEGDKIINLKSNRNLYSDLIQQDFKKIPGAPIAYWASAQMIKNFTLGTPMERIANPHQGMKTLDNDKFIRLWFEVSLKKTNFTAKSTEHAMQSKKKWFPINHGGEYRKWYGNNDYLVNWEEDGRDIKNLAKRKYNSITRTVTNINSYFKPGITWTVISSGKTSFRHYNDGFLFSNSGQCLVPEDIETNKYVGGFLNSKVCLNILQMLSPALGFESGYLKKLPIILNDNTDNIVRESCVILAKNDWNSLEISWDFEELPLLDYKSSLTASYNTYCENCKAMTTKMKVLEEENNRFFIDTYSLDNELTSTLSEEEVTLFANPKYRYGNSLSDDELRNRFKKDTIKELISYAVGCMMGRYSLDEPKLIYAHCGNEGYDPSRYQTFPADDDGIIPITDRYWFDDDAVERFFKFIEIVWPKETLEENLDLVAEAIGRKSSKTSREAIRRFFVNDFFKDHLKRYKKRPIYWLFSSGKEKALQCLVYLHRYNEGTLSRMRTEYLIPLQGRIASKIESLKKDMEHASSTSAANRIQKDITNLEKQAEELRKYDEKLRHYADMKIKLDLDNGVKVNYGKFVDLLAEVKAVTGNKAQ
ncbi:BREX-1 system adenine-specific DNA-methyltransferase PglX [Planctomycetota bacterium]